MKRTCIRARVKHTARAKREEALAKLEEAQAELNLRWARDVQRATVSDIANSCEQERLPVPA